MIVDIISLFDDYNITYYTCGKNVSPGWVNINCPFCGDRSWHLGYNMAVGYFHCWRCGGGKNTKKVLREILRLSPVEIDSIIFDYSVRKIALLNSEKKSFAKVKQIELPGTKKLGKACRKYITQRGFNPDYLVEKYGIQDGGISGEWKYRIVIPIVLDEKIVSFQARDYTGRQQLRYKNCKDANSIVSLKNTLYNIDNCNEYYIAIVEGVFDCWKFGDNFCASFGTSMTENQISLLYSYKKIYFLFDNELEAQDKATNYARKLAAFGKEVEVIGLDMDENKDAADLSFKQAKEIIRELKK